MVKIVKANTGGNNYFLIRNAETEKLMCWQGFATFALAKKYCKMLRLKIAKKGRR